MKNLIDLQIACQETLPVSKKTLFSWVTLTLEKHKKISELTIRLVEIDEIAHLNKTYRKKEGPTNVLAFPSDLPEEIALECPFIGDIIICPSVLQKEALEQHKTLESHWAHITIHGVLHLLGYDHIKEEDEIIMQAMEISLLNLLGYDNPYLPEDSAIE